MISHHPVGDAGNLNWLIERRLREEEKALDQLRQNFGEKFLRELFDGMVQRHMLALIGCTNDQERLMVQALVAVTVELKNYLIGAIQAEENKRIEAEMLEAQERRQW